MFPVFCLTYAEWRRTRTAPVQVGGPDRSTTVAHVGGRARHDGSGTDEATTPVVTPGASRSASVPLLPTT